MTARVCPVHGEYAADGICRWCEPAPEAVELPGMAGQWRKPDRVEVNEAGVPTYFWDLGPAPKPLPAPTYMGVPVVVDPHMSADAAPVLVSWALIDKTADAYVWRLEWTGLDIAKILRTYQPEYLARIGFRAIYIPTAADLPIQPPVVLEYQHAALRWERVARRWATKAKFDGHERTVDGTLAFDDRCSECRRTMRLTDAGIPKEWP